MFLWLVARRHVGWRVSSFRRLFGSSGLARAEECSSIQNVLLKALEIEVDHRSYVERNKLRDHQTTHHDQTQRTTRRTMSTKPQCDRQGSKHSGQRSHEDWSKAVHARVVDRLFGRFTRLNSLTREVDDHDAVLLHDSHQHKHADKRIERRFLSKHEQRE